MKDLFHTKNELFEKFCNISGSNSCNVVINSTRWKFLEKVNFSDLSFIFFAVQVISLLLYSFSGKISDFFSLQFWFLLFSVPVILISLYYQKFVVQKWCPICLMISGIITVELFFVTYLFRLHIPEMGYSLFYIYILFLVFSFWKPVKNLIKKCDQFEKTSVEFNRFKRNYSFFKNNLIADRQYDLPSGALIFGNQTALTHLTIITSPFCNYCKEPHYLIRQLLRKFDNNLMVSILYNVNEHNEDLFELCSRLTEIGLESEDNYFHAMDYWYEKKDVKKWIQKYGEVSELRAFRHSLKIQNDWCVKNNFNFTPCMFINGYHYPNSYKIEDFEYLVQELIEDKDFY